MICIKIESVEEDSGDCDNGCWNSAYGYKILVDGVEDDALYPSASCFESTNYGPIDLANYILEKARIHGAENIHVEPE